MMRITLIQCIGLSHLLQAPLTAYLASPHGLDLRRAVTTTSPLGAAVAHNMAFASVALPTALGVALAFHAKECLEPGAGRTFALLLGAFWCWRLLRQLVVLSPLWPTESREVRFLNRLLTSIFVMQGPLLVTLVLRD